jgi:AcrR family transcriptional regulator
MSVQDKMVADPAVGECMGGKLRCARDRIFQAASDLFYRKGIQAVGVEAIAEEANTTKMSLYRHFASKDELVAAWLREVNVSFWKLWDELRARHPHDPRGQLSAFFAKLSEHCADPNSRGCAAANAAVELTNPDHPARKVIEAHKAEIRAHVIAVCKEMRVADPNGLGDALFLLMEGAQASTQTLGHQGPARAIAAAADALIDAHLRLPPAPQQDLARHA